MNNSRNERGKFIEKKNLSIKRARIMQNFYSFSGKTADFIDGWHAHLKKARMTLINNLKKTEKFLLKMILTCPFQSTIHTPKFYAWLDLYEFVMSLKK